MIVSVSRRTDIPACYWDWFLHRLAEGEVLVRNPINQKQVSRLLLTPQTVDYFVFWSKNPASILHQHTPLLDYLFEIQYTITPYGREIEPQLPPVETRIHCFRSLAHKFGNAQVIWRYDPILLSSKYTMDFHMQAFQTIAYALKDSVQTVVISFLDCYAKIQKRLQLEGLYPPDQTQMMVLAKHFAQIACECGFQLQTCAEEVDLSAFGIARGNCIDAQRIQTALGHSIHVSKDPNQRPLCGCTMSIDIGSYDTCTNGCVYCYANASAGILAKKITRFEPKAPMLCDEISQGDTIRNRSMPSIIKSQQSLFD